MCDSTQTQRDREGGSRVKEEVDLQSKPQTSSSALRQLSMILQVTGLAWLPHLSLACCIMCANNYKNQKQAMACWQ